MQVLNLYSPRGPSLTDPSRRVQSFFPLGEMKFTTSPEPKSREPMEVAVLMISQQTPVTPSNSRTEVCTVSQPIRSLFRKERPTSPVVVNTWLRKSSPTVAWRLHRVRETQGRVLLLLIRGR